MTMSTTDKLIRTVNSTTATKAAKEQALREIRRIERLTGEEIIGPYNQH